MSDGCAPLSRVLGLSVAAPYLVATHSPFALRMLQKPPAPDVTAFVSPFQSLVCVSVSSLEFTELNGIAAPYLICWGIHNLTHRGFFGFIPQPPGVLFGHSSSYYLFISSV